MNVGMPQFTVPPIDPRTGQWNRIWWLFFQDLWARTGGAQGSDSAELRLNDIDVDANSVSADLQTAISDLSETNAAMQLAVGDPDVLKVTAALNDVSTLARTLTTDDGFTPQQASLLSKVVDLSLILEEAQDVAKKLRKAIDDALIDGMTPIEPVRSLAYQDASRVAISGGSINGTPVGATAASSGAFTTLDAAATTVTTLTASDQVTGTKTYSAGPALKATTSSAGQASTFAATNGDSSQFLVGYSGQSGDPTSAIWWKAGTRLRFATATDTQASGFTERGSLDANGLVITAGFGCNGKTAQTAYSLGAAATDLASVISLANNLRTMAINNGTGA